MTPEELRREVAIHLALQLGEGWEESFYPYGLFPDLDSRHDHHQSFCVGVPSSGALQGRQQGHIAVTTTVMVAFTFQLRPDDLPTSYDEALQAEMAVIRALASVKNALGGQPYVIKAIERTILEELGDVFLGVIQGQVTHPIPLT